MHRLPAGGGLHRQYAGRIEGRGGNSPATYAPEQTLRRAFAHLQNHQLTIGRSRADSASYQKAVVEVVAAHCERLFDIMNNDFGWSRLPCSFLSENTAFMILSAIIANFYRYLISTYAQRIQWLKAPFRLKKFIFRPVSVPAKWIKTGRQEVLKLYTRKDYRPLLE